MAYVFPGEGSLDYYPCHYGSSRILFRGPKQNTEAAYVAVLGGTETYGKFVQQPYPALLEQDLRIPVVNLGYVNAGTDVFLNEQEVLQIAHKARVTVVQILGAQNMSNRFYTVHPRRNDRFVAASPLLRSIYPKVDFTEFNFTRHMLMALQRASADRFEVVSEELRAAWVARMQQLLTKLGDRTVLLWMSDRLPPQPVRRVDLSHAPLLIDTEMVAAVRAKATSYLEIAYSPEARALGTDGMVFAPMEAPAAAQVPNAAIHAELAAKLGPVVQALIDR